jgi:cation:H+ antiporter
LFMTLDLRLSRAHGLVLIALGLGYFAWDFVIHYRDRKPQDVQEAIAIAAEQVAERRILQTKAGTVIQFLFGAGVVVVGSRLLVDGAVNVANWMGIPPIVVGLTIVGIGTSMPELVTAITSLRRNVSDLSIGNVIGANVANLSLVVGTAAVLSDVRIDRTTQLFNFPAMLVLMALLVVFLNSGHRVSRREGATLVSAYVVYLAALTGITLLTQ